MNAVTLKFEIQMHRIVAELEGMKAVNAQRAHCGESMAYTDDQFFARAKELDDLHNHLHAAWQDGHAT